MIHRIAAALLLGIGLVACKETGGGGGGGGTPIAQILFQGVGDVKVLDAKYVSSGDSAAGISAGTITYVIARVELTNDFNADATPQIDHFYLIDQNGNRYQAKDSGSQVFIGVSNSQEILKKGDKREYTIGFRTSSPNITGTIEYAR